MKVGILTFHNTTNYGAVFQTYALQKFINSLDVDCEVIDYNNNFLNKSYSINPFISNNFKLFLKKLIYFNNNFKLKSNFKKFSKKHIRFSSVSYNEKNISEADKIYDSFLSGSDQVWNLKLNGYDSNYFVSFSKNLKKRNSYSASLGKVDFDDKEFELLKNLISNQNYISVRENQSINILNKFVKDKFVQAHIDPTFLIKKDEWEGLADDYVCNKDYIFVYEVSRTPYLRDFALYLSKKYNLDLIFISGSSKNIEGAKKLNGVSPERFLGLIKNSTFVVTSSFHGLALSLIMNKNVYFDTNSGVGNLSSRLDNLADILQVSNRKINKDFNSNDFNNINFDCVNDLINLEIDKSTLYLKNVLEIKE